jgi:NAD(P)-dependent dehydrogenase (short-subunit alcohol dehydrogenase family)
VQQVASVARQPWRSPQKAGASWLQTLTLQVRNLCAAAVKRTVDEFGGLDIAFNNAGVATRISKEFEDFTLEEWRRVIDVNLGGVFNCMKAEAPALKAAGGGAIVNTASVTSFIAGPGMVRTAMLAPLMENPDAMRHMESKMPIGRVGEAEEIARTVLFLASEDASYMVGTLLSVDGGVIIQ